MDEYELEALLRAKKYPDSLISWAIKLYPTMCEYFGHDNTDKFFQEYELVPIQSVAEFERVGGTTYRDKKKVTANWMSGGSQHEALILLIHEASHAMGQLSAPDDSMLMEGREYNEDFLTKLEEGFVCEKQFDLEYGELDYTYKTICTLDDKDEFHKADFKTHPTSRYTINCVYYKLIQLLLGENKNLVYQNMFAKTREEKNNVFHKIVSLFKEQLTEEEFAILMDCVCTFVINYSYDCFTFTTSSYEESEFKTEKAREDYISRLKTIIPKNYAYAEKRNLFGKNIFDSIDDLCSLTLDVMMRRLQSNEYDRFSAIKEACTYFTKIDNNNEKLSEKTKELKKVLIEKISEMFPQLISLDFQDYSMTESDKFTIITQILTLSSVSDKDSNISFSYSDDDINVAINDCESYNVKKINVYSEEEDIQPSLLELAKPIGYRILLEKDQSFAKEMTGPSLK